MPKLMIEQNLYKKWTYISNLIILNILFIVFSIPIITLGPSMYALIESIKHLDSDNQDKVSLRFFQLFKSKLVNGVIVSLIWVISLFKFLFELNALQSVINNSLIYFIVYFLLTGMYVFVFTITYKIVFSITKIKNIPSLLMKTIKEEFDSIMMIFLILFPIVSFVILVWNPIICYFFILVGFSLIVLLLKKWMQFTFNIRLKTD